MLTDRHFPYSSMQEINLDWILTKVKNILRFVPDDGAVGQILRRTAHGAEWSDEQGAGGSVTSVNGMQGAVVLDASDVGALPDTTVIPSDTSDLTNTAGFVDAAGAAAAAPVQSVNSQTGAVVLGKSDVGLGSVDNVQQYSASNPPPYPVTSVNGQTGAVVISTGSPLDAYPVGSIYMSVNNTSPSVLFGGTWMQLKDKFLLGAGDVYNAGDTGGEAAHTLSENELPVINGSFKSRPWASGGMFYDATGHFTSENSENILGCTNSGVSAAGRKISFSFGSGNSHNNMPPYLVVYMWQRTA